jgi:hypothetical protein
MSQEKHLDFLEKKKIPFDEIEATFDSQKK